MRAAREQAALLGCLYGNRADLRDQILALDGGTGVVLASQFNPNGLPPSWWMIRQGDFIFIVNAGTTNSKQWSKHFTGALGTVVERYPKTIVHPFFWDAGVVNNFATMKQILGAALGQFQYRISGHSFGGGTGHLIAREFVREVGANKVQLMTFGEPRTFASAGEPPWTPSVHWRFDKSGDLVTSLPPVWTRIALSVFELRKIGTWPQFPSKAFTRFMEGKPVFQEPGLIALWRHSGRQAWVWPNGMLQLEGEGRVPGAGQFQAGIHRNLERDHIIPTGYWPHLVANLNRYPNPAESGLVAIGNVMVAEYGEHTYPDLPITQYVNPAALRDFVMRDPAAQITQAEGARSQGTALIPSNIRLEAVSNGEFLGSAIVADFWDVTLAINNDEYGKTQTFCLGTAGTLAEAYANCEVLIGRRAALLGRQGNEVTKQYALPNGKGSPAVEMLKIVDPKVPRFGQVFDVPFAWGEPHSDPGSGDTSNAADPLWNAISISLYALNGASRKRYTLTIVGIPDRMIRAGEIMWNYQYGGTPAQTLATKMAAFLNELTNSPRAWGLSGADPAVPTKTITAFTIDADNQLVCTAAGHGYADGDKVQVNRNKSHKLRRVWEVSVVDANSFRLVGSQFTPIEQPTGTAKAKLYQNAAGVRQVAFYRFQPHALGAWQQPFDAQVRKRNPGRRVNRLSFARRLRQA